MISVIAFHPSVTAEHLGLLPFLLDESDPRSAREQFHENYSYGGGWQPMPNFTLTGNTLHYPGDPVLVPIAAMLLRRETVLVYEFSIVAIVQPDGSFEVARMD